MTTLVRDLATQYQRNTPKRLKIIDGFIGYALLSAALQFLYCALVGTFPFNAFLSGFFASVGFAVLLACLRITAASGSGKASGYINAITPERAFGDFFFAFVLLNLAVFNFIG